MSKPKLYAPMLYALCALGVVALSVVALSGTSPGPVGDESNTASKVEAAPAGPLAFKPATESQTTRPLILAPLEREVSLDELLELKKSGTDIVTVGPPTAGRTAAAISKLERLEALSKGEADPNSDPTATTESGPVPPGLAKEKLPEKNTIEIGPAELTAQDRAKLQGTTNPPAGRAKALKSEDPQ